MKFGKLIVENSVPEWATHYINYKCLKQIIKVELHVSPLFEATRKITMNADMNSFIPRLSAASNVQSDDEESDSEGFGHSSNRFILELERQVERVNTFYLRRESEYRARFRLLETQLLNPHKLFNHKNALCQFQEDLAKLQSYVELNEMAVRKIVKKWKKQSGRLFKFAKVENSKFDSISPCFSAQSLAEMSDSVLRSLSKLEGRGDDENWEPNLCDHSINEAFQEQRLLSLLLSGDFNRAKNLIRPEAVEELFLKFCAAREANLSALDFLQSISPINYCVEDIINGRTGIHYAAEVGNLEIIERCVENGANPFAHDVSGKSPIFLAATNGHDAIIRYFIKLDQNLSLKEVPKGTDGMSPLEAAVVNNHVNCVKALLEHNTCCDLDWQRNPLICIASENSNVDIVRVLVDAGASISQPNIDGYYPMHIVCQTGCQEIFDILASQKTSDSELKRKDRYNRLQPIFYAAIYGNSNIVRALIDKGCSIECVDEKGWLPWIHALWNGWIDTAAMLECKYKIVAHPLDVSFAEMPPLSLDNSTTEKENDENVLSLLFLPPPAIPTTGKSALKYTRIKIQMVDLMLQNSSFAIKIMISQHFKDGIQRQYEEVPYTIIYPIQEESSFFFSEQSGDDYYFQISIYPAFGQTTIGRALITCSQINLASKNSIINAFGSFLMISPILSAKLMQPTGEVKLNFSLINPCIEAVDTRMVDIYKNQGVGDTCKKYQIVHVNFKKQNGEVEYANNDGTAGAKLDQVLNNTNQRIAFEITWTSFANANNSCAALNAAIDRLLVDASSMRADVIFLSSVPSVCEALALKQPNYSVFFISMWNQEKDSPMQLEIQRSLKEAVRFCKTNHLEGLVCSGKSLLKELVKEIKRNKLRVIVSEEEGLFNDIHEDGTMGGNFISLVC